MAVDDHGLEVLKKSGEEVVSGKRGDHFIKTADLESAALIGGKSYLSSTNLITVAGTSESPFFYVLNPGSSGKQLRVGHIFSAIDSNTARSVQKVYFNPTVTVNGTSVPIQNMLIGGISSSMSAFSQPTVSSNGTFLLVSVVPTSNVPVILERKLILSPGQSILVTIQNSINNTPSSVEISWVEVIT